MLEVFETQFWQGVVWTLLHSIWQATIIALLLGFALRLISAKRASLRYWISVSALVGLVLASFFTYHVGIQFRDASASSLVEQVSSVIPSVIPSAPSEVSNLPVDASGAVATPSKAWVGISWTSLAALFWLIGVTVMGLRTLSAVFRGNQLSSVTPIESSQHLDILKDLSRKLGLGKVPSFWSSAASHTPYAVGFLAPAIVVPLSMLTSLSPTELQAVLAHELAHVRRNDYLANLFQMVIEAFYFFNPAVWWISRQIRVEREACCDQIAIESASSKVGYATILADWMESMVEGVGATLDDAPAPGLAFADKQPSGMLERIQRILKPDSKPRLRVSSINLVFVLAASMMIACLMNASSKAVVQVLSDSDRISKIEARQGKVGGPSGTLDGKFELIVRVTTEDGGEVENGYATYKTLNERDNSQGSVGSFKTGQELKDSFPSGIVQLEFSSKNYAPATLGPIESSKGQTVVRELKLIKGQPHVIRVVDESGNPVLDADVQMSPYSSKSADEKGNYIFQHLQPGKKSELRVEKDGYIPQRSVVTNDGKTEVTLMPNPISKGLVLTAEGEPVPGAEITIPFIKHGPNHFSMVEKKVATTDQQGRFETRMLNPKATYWILVRSNLGVDFKEDLKVGDDLNFTIRPLCNMEVTIKGDLDQLHRNQHGFLYMHFHQNSCVSGKLFGEGFELIEESKDQVRVKIKGMFPGKFNLSSGNSFRVSGEAKPGDHSVEFIAQPEDPKPSLVDVKIQFECDGKRVQPGGTLTLGPRPGYEDDRHSIIDGELKASVEPGDHILNPEGLVGFTFEGIASIPIAVEADGENEFTIQVMPAGAVAGKLVDANGDPVFNARFSCRYSFRHPKNGNRQSSGIYSKYFKTDSKGNFLLTPIPLGSKVTVRAGDKFNPAISEELFIDEAKPVAEVNLQTAEPAKAKLRVVDPEGNPIPGAEVSIDCVGGGWRYLYTDAKGEMEISPMHPTWEYKVTAKAKKGFVMGEAELVQGETTVLKLEPGCVVRGQLLDKDGNPVAKRCVCADVVTDHSPFDDYEFPPLIESDRNTDEQGRFEFTRLPKGEFWIRVAGAHKAYVNAGDEVQTVELWLKDDRE